MLIEHLVVSKDEADRIVGPSSNRFRVEGFFKSTILKASSSVDVVDEFEGLFRIQMGRSRKSRVFV